MLNRSHKSNIILHEKRNHKNQLGINAIIQYDASARHRNEIKKELLLRKNEVNSKKKKWNKTKYEKKRLIYCRTLGGNDPQTIQMKKFNNESNIINERRWHPKNPHRYSHYH